MRSYEQFERKVVATGTGYEALPERSEDVGRDQLDLLELQRSGGLRRWWDERVAAGDEDGELLRDTRLADFAGGEPAPPDDAARRLIASAFAAHAELEAAHERLRKGAVDLEYAETQLWHARQELEARRAELGALREAHARLLGSRVVRASAPLRRAFYRLRGR
jgi:hypothetical protein